MSAKQRLTSAVVVSQSFQRQQQKREKEKSEKYSSSDEHKSRKYTDQHDRRSEKGDRLQSVRNDHGHLHSRKYIVDDEEDSDGNRSRRGWQSERKDNVSVFDRLSSGYVRNQQREERQVIEVETDPCDVPRGKRYFEHDDRGADRSRGYINQNLNNRNPRHSFQRQRSRSPVWKHDHFEDFERKERGFVNYRRQNRNSSVWKHDKFEEHEMKDDKMETRHKNRQVHQERRKSQ